MNQFEARAEIKRKLERELISFVDVERIKGYGNTDEEFWYDIRDEWIEELNDRLNDTLIVYGYAHGLQLACALGYWNWEGKPHIKNGEDLGFYASKDYVYEEGLIYDCIDECLLKHFGVELNN